MNPKAQEHVRAANERVQALRWMRDTQVVAGPDSVHRRVNSRGRWEATFGGQVSYRPDPFGDPLRYEPQDHSILSGPWGWRMPNTGARPQVPPVATAAFSVHPQSRGTPWLMRFVGAAPSPAQQTGPDTFLYEDVYTNVDLDVTITHKGIKFDWVFKGPGHPTSFEIQYPNGAASYRRDQFHRWEDGISRVRQHIPFWMDPDHPIERHMVAEELPGNKIRYTLPDMSDVAYPFRFDPQIQVEPDADTETSTVDGYCQRDRINATFSDIRNDTTADSVNDSLTVMYIVISSDTTTNRYDLLRRGYAGWDTSSLGSSASIQSGRINVRIGGTFSGLDGVSWAMWVPTSGPASPTALAVGDFNITNFTPGTPLSDDVVDASGVSTGTQAVYELNSSGLSQINKTAVTFFGLLEHYHDELNSEPSSWTTEASDGITLSTADSTYRSPELTVSYDLPLDILDQATNDSATGDSIATSSVTPTADVDVYVFVVASNNYAGTPTAPTASGCGITWTRIEYSFWSTGKDTEFVLFRGQHSSPSTGAITISFDTSGNLQRYSYVVFQATTYTSGEVQRDQGEDTYTNWSNPASLSLTSTSGASNIVVGLVGQHRMAAFGNQPLEDDYNNFETVSRLPSAYVNTSSYSPFAALMVSINNAETAFAVHYSVGLASDTYIWLVAIELVGLTYVNKIVNETVNVTETVYKLPAIGRIVNETLNITEVVSFFLHAMKVVNETLNITETVLAVPNLRKIVSETINVTETVYKKFVVFTTRWLTDRVLPATRTLADKILPSTRSFKE